MNLPYYCMNMAVLSSYELMYPNILTDNNNLKITFEEYVKSQIHFNITSDLYNRDMDTYYRAYKYLDGESEYRPYCQQVLQYFFEDMSNLLLNMVKYTISVDLDMFKINVDVVDSSTPFDNEMEKKEISLKDVEEDLERVLNGEADLKLDLPYFDVLSKVDLDMLSDLKPCKALALSVVYRAMKDNIMVKLEVV